jgi:tripartite-type tricarboxylate transporter receptor subunit TctC
MFRSTTLFLAAMAWLLAAPVWAADPAWPNKPVRIIVPGDPGGVLDVRARWLAERLTPLLGQSVLVEPKPGAGGSIGTAEGARSAADGYTLTLIHLGTMAANPHLYARLGYDPLADFAPITLLTTGPLLLTVNPGVMANSVAELVRLAKARPGQLNYGSPGVGTPSHLAGELFKRAAGIDVVHVPYKGGALAVAALMAGQIDFIVESPSIQLQHVKSGRLRALAVTGPPRLASLPDIPTAGEAGVPGFEFYGWTGIAAPAGTPKPIIDRLYLEIAKVMATREARDWLELIASYPRTDTPEVFAAGIRADHAKWGKVIREAGIRLE